jgi:glucosamine--fructose-6-phosphate aminotransferase (isomerizing)
MNPELFLADLERKPETLSALAHSLRAHDPWRSAGIAASSHLVFLGMGSSHYANLVAASRLREAGIDAVAELASSDLLPRPRAGTVVIAVSASGSSKETLAAVERYQGKTPIVALTNVSGSDLERLASTSVLMQAGVEEGGVACRTFQHTLALHLALEESLVGDTVNGCRPCETVMRTSEASADPLERRDAWLDPFIEIGRAHV